MEKIRIPKIKICGITMEKEAEYLNEFKVDYAGFVFYEKSKRNVSIGQAEKIFNSLNPNIKKVAVVVSPDIEMIERLNASGFDIIQIHKELKAEIPEKAKKPIWRAVNLTGGSDTQTVTAVFDEKTTEEDRDNPQKRISGILIDAADFGSGKCFDWTAAKETLHLDRRWRGTDFILAGGLNPGNVAEGIRIFEPDIVDVSSGVEGETGKDREKIKQFVHAVRSL